MAQIEMEKFSGLGPAALTPRFLGTQPPQGCSYENSLLAKTLIEVVTIFHKRSGTTFCPNLSQHLECGATKLRVDKMGDAVHRKRTH